MGLVNTLRPFIAKPLGRVWEGAQPPPLSLFRAGHPPSSQAWHGAAGHAGREISSPQTGKKQSILPATQSHLGCKQIQLIYIAFIENVQRINS